MAVGGGAYDGRDDFCGFTQMTSQYYQTEPAQLTGKPSGRQTDGRDATGRRLRRDLAVAGSIAHKGRTNAARLHR